MRSIGGAICVVLLWSATALAQPIVDGVVDGTYGAAIATDKEGDGNGQAVMDLKQLFIWHDATHLYIALTIKGDITDTTTPNNWGKYLIYIDTTNDNLGGTSDPWTRNVLAEDPHKPELVIATWVDQAPYNKSRVELWTWQNGTSWAKVGGMVDDAALAGPTTATPYSVIEMSIKIGALGTAQKIWVEGYSTGGGSTDNAQDTVNNPAEDFNATDWTTQSLIKVSTPYTLIAPTPDAGTPDSTVDSGPAPDTTVDSGPAPDTTVDTGPAPDTTVDSGPAPDTTVDSTVDSGPTPDTTANVDSAAPADSAPPVDSTPADVVGLDPHADEMGVLDGPVQVDTGGGTLDGTPPQGDSGTKPKQDEGCSCEVGRAPNNGLALLLLLGVALLGLRRRDS